MTEEVHIETPSPVHQIEHDRISRLEEQARAHDDAIRLLSDRPTELPPHDHPEYARLEHEHAEYARREELAQAQAAAEEAEEQAEEAAEQAADVSPEGEVEVDVSELTPQPEEEEEPKTVRVRRHGRTRTVIS